MENLFHDIFKKKKKEKKKKAVRQKQVGV